MRKPSVVKIWCVHRIIMLSQDILLGQRRKSWDDVFSILANRLRGEPIRCRWIFVVGHLELLKCRWRLLLPLMEMVGGLIAWGYQESHLVNKDTAMQQSVLRDKREVLSVSWRSTWWVTLNCYWELVCVMTRLTWFTGTRKVKARRLTNKERYTSKVREPVGKEGLVVWSIHRLCVIYRRSSWTDLVS